MCFFECRCRRTRTCACILCVLVAFVAINLSRQLSNQFYDKIHAVYMLCHVSLHGRKCEGLEANQLIAILLGFPLETRQFSSHFNAGRRICVYK